MRGTLPAIEEFDNSPSLEQRVSGESGLQNKEEVMEKGLRILARIIARIEREKQRQKKGVAV